MAETWVLQAGWKDAEFKRAPNLEGILDWVDEYRPDLSADVRGILDGAWKKERNAEAMLLLLVVGFAAGRVYQETHPKTNAKHSEYHR